MILWCKNIQSIYWIWRVCLIGLTITFMTTAPKAHPDQPNERPGGEWLKNEQTQPDGSKIISYSRQGADGTAYLKSINAKPPVVSPAFSNQIVVAGQPATLKVKAFGAEITEMVNGRVVKSDYEAVSYQWFAGSAGDTAHPVTGANSASLMLTDLKQSATYWVRVVNAYGQTDSAAMIAHVMVEKESPRLTAAGRIKIGGGCEAYREAMIDFVPVGDQVEISLSNSQGYFSIDNRPMSGFKFPVSQQQAGELFSQISQLLRDPYEPSRSTRGAKIDINLPLSGGALTSQVSEEESRIDVDLLVKVIDDFVAAAHRQL